MDVQDLYKIYKSRCKEIKKKYGDDFTYNLLKVYALFQDVLSIEEFRKVIKELKRRANKRNRTKAVIMDFVRYKRQVEENTGEVVYMYFVTFTLNDHYAYEVKDRTRDKILDSYIKKHYTVATVNQDRGKKGTERLHYHAIALSMEKAVPKLNSKGIQCRSKKGRLLFELPSNDCILGFNPTLEPIVIEGMDDIDKVKNYFLKLNNHSNKDTTLGRIRVIETTTYGLFKLMNKKVKITSRLKEKDAK